MLSQRHVTRMTWLLHSCKKGQKIKCIRLHCFVFAKWRHLLALEYSLSFIISNIAIMRVCFPPSCRMHSPPSPPRVAAQEAVQSRHTARSRNIVARPGLIAVCPALESEPRSDQISAPKSRTAAFNCDASRTRLGSHSLEKNKKHFTVQTQRSALFISKQ